MWAFKALPALFCQVWIAIWPVPEYDESSCWAAMMPCDLPIVSRRNSGHDAWRNEMHPGGDTKNWCRQKKQRNIRRNHQKPVPKLFLGGDVRPWFIGRLFKAGSGPRVFQHILAGLEKPAAHSFSRGQLLMQRYRDGTVQILRSHGDGSLRRGPYYFQTRCWNAAGISPWSEVSAPLLLKVSEPARLAAVTLVEADNWVKWLEADDPIQCIMYTEMILNVTGRCSRCILPSIKVERSCSKSLDFFAKTRPIARRPWLWSTSKRETSVRSMVGTSSTTSWGVLTGRWMAWKGLMLKMFVTWQQAVRTDTDMFETGFVSRYARKEDYLADPDAGVLNLEESGGAPDQAGSVPPIGSVPHRCTDKTNIHRGGIVAMACSKTWKLSSHPSGWTHHWAKLSVPGKKWLEDALRAITGGGWTVPCSKNRSGRFQLMALGSGALCSLKQTMALAKRFETWSFDIVRFPIFDESVLKMAWGQHPSKRWPPDPSDPSQSGWPKACWTHTAPSCWGLSWAELG